MSDADAMDSSAADTDTDNQSDTGGDVTDTGPEIQITTVSIEPGQIAASEAGMTDEVFTVTIEIAGASEPPSSVELYLQTATGRRAAGDIQVLTAEEVMLDVPYTWASGLDAGEYPIDVELDFGGTETVSQTEATSLEITSE